MNSKGKNLINDTEIHSQERKLLIMKNMCLMNILERLKKK